MKTLTILTCLKKYNSKLHYILLDLVKMAKNKHTKKQMKTKNKKIPPTPKQAKNPQRCTENGTFVYFYLDISSYNIYRTQRDSSSKN